MCFGSKPKYQQGYQYNTRPVKKGKKGYGHAYNAPYTYDGGGHSHGHHGGHGGDGGGGGGDGGGGGGGAA